MLQKYTTNSFSKVLSEDEKKEIDARSVHVAGVRLLLIKTDVLRLELQLSPYKSSSETDTMRENRCFRMASIL